MLTVSIAAAGAASARPSEPARSRARRPSMRANWPASTTPAPPSDTAARAAVARSERAHPNRVRAAVRRRTRVGRRAELTRSSLAAGSSALLGDDRLHGRDRAVGQLDLDHVGADLADRLLEAHLSPVDAQVACLADRVG